MSEGSKTEGLYMSLFTRRLRAANVAIELLGKECGSDPLTVVQFARDRFLEDVGYDLCYCLIDRDTHPIDRFNDALQLASATDSKARNREFTVIVSYPCVEFWFLLHFVYRRAPFVAEKGRSPADCAIAELKKHLPQYAKTAKEELLKLMPLTQQAVDHAIRVEDDVAKTGELNPSTKMHIVIERIFKEAPKEA